MNSRFSGFLLSGLLLILLPNLCFGQLSKQDTTFKVRPFELSAKVSHVPIYKGDATVGKISNTGYMIEAGYRPNVTDRRLLIEGFLFHTPKNKDRYNPSPQISSIGVATNYLLLSPVNRVNPFLGIGFGLYKIDDLNEPACLPSEGCFSEGGPNYEDETMQAFTLNSGIYLSIIPTISLQGEINLYLPTGSKYDNIMNDESRFTYLIGLSFRI